MMTKMFTVGMLSTNCYVTSCKETRDAIIIDPGFDDQLAAEKIIKFINENALELKFIINTHGHPDHTCGNGIIKEKFHVSILIHEDDAYMLEELNKKTARFFGSNSFSPPADALLHDGNLVKFGKITLKVMHTPGHTYGSISLLGKKEVFTGDTLFAGSIGRTDLREVPNCFLILKEQSRFRFSMIRTTRADPYSSPCIVDLGILGRLLRV